MEQFRNKISFLNFLQTKHEADHQFMAELHDGTKNVFSHTSIKNTLPRYKNSIEYFYLRVEEILSDELFEFIAYYELDLQILDIYIIECVNDIIKKDKKKRLSDDVKEYNREIQQIKKNIDKLAEDAFQDGNRFELPIMGRGALGMLNYYLELSQVSKKTSDLIFVFFDQSRTRSDHSFLKVLLFLHKKIINDIVMKLSSNSLIKKTNSNLTLNDIRSIILHHSYDIMWYRMSKKVNKIE